MNKPRVATVAELAAEGIIVSRITTVTCQRAVKGGLSFYGLARFPFTFYKEQLLAFLAYVDAPAFRAKLSAMPDRDRSTEAPKAPVVGAKVAVAF